MQNHTEFIKQKTDLCVFCGYCIKNCPTYQHTKIDTETPRARIVVLNQVIKKNAEPNTRFLEQINNCLQCGSCDRVCPMDIPITKLMSLAKSQFKPKKSNIYLWLAKNSNYFKKFSYLSSLFLPKTMKIKFQQENFINQKNTNLALFLGCTGDLFDNDTKNSIINILKKLKIDVQIPKTKCCGSLHFHEGDLESSEKLINQNYQVLQKQKVKKLLYFTSGCSYNLKQTATKLNIQVQEIISFLSKQDFSKLKFKPLKSTVAVHIPCSHQNDKNLENDITKLLNKIPNIKFRFIKTLCCGSAGLHMLKNKNRANKMRENTLNLIYDTHIILTTNIGCRLHLANGLKTNEMKNFKIIHPIFLLNQQIDNTKK